MPKPSVSRHEGYSACCLTPEQVEFGGRWAVHAAESAGRSDVARGVAVAAALRVPEVGAAAGRGSGRIGVKWECCRRVS